MSQTIPGIFTFIISFVTFNNPMYYLLFQCPEENLGLENVKYFVQRPTSMRQQSQVDTDRETGGELTTNVLICHCLTIVCFAYYFLCLHSHIYYSLNCNSKVVPYLAM